MCAGGAINATAVFEESKLLVRASHALVVHLPENAMAAPSRQEVERLADQLRRACEGAAWHGPAVFDLLADVPAEQAAARPLTAAHSIWEVVLHVQTWQDEARQRLEGATEALAGLEDWPAVVDTSAAAWQAAQDALRASFQNLHAALAGLTDDRLEAHVPGKEFSFYVLLHGVVQHNLYHAGQIALLKKRCAPV